MKFAATRFRAMELITILTAAIVSEVCLPPRPVQCRQEEYRSGRATAQRFGCARCHLPTPGYDQLAERRFEFIPLWGFLDFLLYTMRRLNRRRCGIVAVEEVPWGDGKRTLTKAYMLFLARWAQRLSWKGTAEAFRTNLLYHSLGKLPEPSAFGKSAYFGIGHKI